MNSVNDILQKLELFIKKYYTNELMKGGILFISFGAFYFLLTLGVEYFLWFGKLGRLFLFWVFIASEIILLGWFIIRPFFELFKLKRGLDYPQAAEIIGRHFSEVDDKLLNLLQLNSSFEKDELLLAGIEQKAQELRPIPFQRAIDFGNNLKYLRFALPPLIILGIIWFSGTLDFFDSYRRVVHYNTAFVPPPPFQYQILNTDLTTVQNNDFHLFVKTMGDIIPSEVKVVFENQSYLMKQTGIDAFAYTFSRPQSDVAFFLQSSDVQSKDFHLHVVEAPTMLQINVQLDYPAYTQKKDEVVANAGSMTLPEGTDVKWSVSTRATSEMLFVNQSDSLPFKLENGQFHFQKRFFDTSEYSLISSNDKLKYYETLDYKLSIVKDEYPKIQVKKWVDTLRAEKLYFAGETTDDYGISEIKLIYFPVDEPNLTKFAPIPVVNKSVTRFNYVFPGDIELQEGKAYELFFEASDNDAVHGRKKSVSESFLYRKLTQAEIVSTDLKNQKQLMENINKTASQLEKADKQLEEINKLQKTQNQLSWNDQQKFKNLIESQKKQEEMMKSFSEDLLKNLENSKDSVPLKALQQRIERNQQEAQQNEKILEELQRISDKLSQTEISEKIEQLSKQSKSRKKSLQQLLELAKRFYVSQKLQNLVNQLESLSNKQALLSEKNTPDNNPENQNKLNQSFDDFKEQLNDLFKENGTLQKPLKLKRDQIAEKEITKSLQQAQKSLSEKNDKQAQSQQKHAAEKMKNLAKFLQQEMGSSQGEQLQEDLDVLRQILDNLLAFSFSQENLLERVSNSKQNDKILSLFIKEQYSLRENFQHIDDSLFALSLRRPEFSEMINKEIENLYEYIDKTLAQLSEYENYKAVSSQQYVLTSANKLADFLSDILDNIQEEMSNSKGSSGSKEFQLPDIIKQQEAINDAMEKKLGQQKSNSGESGKEGKEGKENESDGKSDGKNGKQNGQDGQKQSQSGKEGDGLDSEQDFQALLEIYKQQQALKFQLADLIKKEGLTLPNSNLLKQAEQIEQELLLKGFNSETLSKMNSFKHQLLKLQDATNQQNDEQKRKAETSKKEFSPADTIPIEIQQYFQELEILNRQALPLRPIFRHRINKYFTGSNDTLQKEN